MVFILIFIGVLVVKLQQQQQQRRATLGLLIHLPCLRVGAPSVLRTAHSVQYGKYSIIYIYYTVL